MSDRGALARLAALVVAHALLGAVWLAHDTLPAGQESCNHLRLAQRIALDLEAA